MNSCNFVGRITTDVELKTTNSGKYVCSFSLAVNRPRVKDTTDFINIVAWNQSAEYLSKYAHKGDRISVSGVLTSRNYEDKNGNKRTAFEIVSNDVSILESKKSESHSQEPNIETSSFSQGNFDEVDFEDISCPF